MLNVDTSKMKKCGQDIVKLSQELNDLIQNLYSRIYNMPTLTREWVGSSAELFVRQANHIEKKDAIKLKNTLKEFGENLIVCANKYDLEIKKNI